MEHGWVRRESGPTPFSLNVSHLYELAGNSHEHLSLPGLVMPTLIRLRDRLGESAVLGVPTGSSMVYLAFAPSLHAVTVREAVGSARPMHASAFGKAYLSALSTQELEEALKAVDFRGATERALKSIMELRQVAASARELGYATDIEECFQGVICVGVPLRIGHDGLLIGAVAVSGPRERLITLGVERVAEVLKDEVAQLEAQCARATSSVTLPSHEASR